MRTSPRRHPALAWLALAVVALAACGGDGATPPGSGSTPAGNGDDDTTLAVAVASFDVAVGDQRRLLAGLYTPERELLGFGEVAFELASPGDGGTLTTRPELSTTAAFLPVAGMGPQDTGEPGPRLLGGDPGSGVYTARVDLDQPGRWRLRVVAELADGRTLTGETGFDVHPAPRVLDVGDEAPRAVNLTIEDAEAGDAPPAAVDSRAGGLDPTIPSPHLHDTRIPDVLDEGRPLVVVASTPVYCQSRFCGPLTDVIADLALDHADRAAFVHLEVWHDFEARELNEAALAWIEQEGGGGNEPWVFLVGDDGRVAARWDNVLDVGELEALLAAL